MLKPFLFNTGENQNRLVRHDRIDFGLLNAGNKWKDKFTRISRHFNREFMFDGLVIVIGRVFDGED